jgi:diguanylate cyclase (GGDEF)-like protein
VAITTVNGSRGFIMLENENTHELELKVAHGLPNAEAEQKINAGLLEAARVPRGEGIQGRVMESREPLIINNVFAEEEAFFGLDSHSKSLMCVPLIMHDTAFGVIYLTSKEYEEPFDKEDLDVISILSSHASAVLDQSRLYALATTDDLTGLYTRRYYSQKIGDEYKRALRYQRHLAMIVLDIDYFKKINDEYGHPAGDFVLKRIAKVFKSVIRIDVDTAVRFGGEEFVLILPETHLSGATVVGERIRKAIEEELIIFDGKLIPVTLSVGISAYPENGSSIEELFTLADRALYVSKTKGRNRVSTYPES